MVMAISHNKYFRGVETKVMKKKYCTEFLQSYCDEIDLFYLKNNPLNSIQEELILLRICED